MRALEGFVILLFAMLVLAVLWGVFSRYIPGIKPADWAEELSIHLLVWISLLGAALAYRQQGHLGVDYFVGKLHPDAQRLAYLAAQAIVLFFGAFALLVGGIGLVRETLGSGQTTAVLQWKSGYVYLAVPLSGLFFCSFALEHLLKPSPTAGMAEKDL